jgi:predicted negative regulator of RcsB-dependent stress response
VDGLGYEGLGDCYAAKGDKQKAAAYYRKYLSHYYDHDHTVEKKLKDLGY